MKIERAPFVKYAEISQTSTTKMSLVKKVGDGEYLELCSPVKCRDFFGDALFSNETGEEVYIYSFKWNTAKPKLDTDATRIMMVFTGVKEKNIFRKNITGVFPHKFYKNLCIIEAPAFWQTTIWQMSFLTFYLRILCYDLVNLVDLELNKDNVDGVYMNEVSYAWDDIVEFANTFRRTTETISGYDGEYISCHMLHNCSGFLTLFQKNVYGDVKKNVYYQAFQNFRKNKELTCAAAPAIAI